MKITTWVLMLALGLISSDIKIFGQQLTDQPKPKAAIIAIQNEVVDFTNPLEPFYCKRFIAMRNSISKATGDEIVLLIRSGELTITQSEIGIGLLTGLSETDYWETTVALLSTNTPEEVLDSVLCMPMPYGACFANAYTNKLYKSALVRLKTDIASKRVKENLDFILSGDAAKTYQDYLKHPDRYGYSPINGSTHN